MDDLRHTYFDWLYGLVSDWPELKKRSYKKLLYCLYTIDFEYLLPMDANRYDDGIELRYKFGKERNIDQRKIASELDNKPCSILEMMIALAIRMEDDVMDNPEEDNRTAEWFWVMIDSLGLYDQDDILYCRDIIGRKMKKFNDRLYGPNGKGGLFTIPDCSEDLRDVEIWCQAMWWLNYILR